MATETPAIDAGRPLPDEAIAAPRPPADDAPADVAPAKTGKVRRSRSGTSGAERARRAKAGAAGSSDKAPRGRATTRRPAAIGKRVTEAHLTIALGLSLVPQPWAMPVSLSLTQQAEQIGAAWEQVAKENPRVADMLERILTAGVAAQVLAAYLPVVLTAAAASGKLPAGLGGIAANAPAAGSSGAAPA